MVSLSEHYQCVEGQYKCINTSKCISSTAVCDGVDDCGDNEDEKQCGIYLRWFFLYLQMNTACMGTTFFFQI